MANMIKFYRGLANSLPTTGENGALYITTDEGAIYYGTGTGMKRLGDFVQVDAVANLPEKAHESCLYYCVAENILAKWNGTEWKQINKQPTAEEMKTLLGLGSAAYTDASAYDAAGSAKAVSDYVGTIPTSYTETNVISYINKKAEETLAAAQGGSSETAASVKQQLDNYKSENDTRVKAAEDAIDAVEGRMDTAEGKITSLETESAKHALKTDVETELAKKVDKVTGYSLVADTEIARLADVDNYDDEEVRGLIGDNADAIEAINDKIGEVAEDKTVVEMIADAKTEATYDDTALAGRVKAIEDDYLKEADKYDDTQVKADIKANADAIDAIEADYLTSDDKTELQDQITTNANAIERLTNGVSAEEVDGVNDLIQYVKDHGTTVKGMQDGIAENAKAISDHEALAAETYETKDDAAAKLAEAKKYADDINTAIDGRLDVLEAINHEAYIAADATLKSELQAEIDADVKALADGQVKTNTEAIATKANAADVYAKTETYTQEEVDAAIEAAITEAHTWGSF